MNEPAKRLATGLDVRLQTLVNGITRWAGRWRLHGDDGSDLGEFDWVLSAIPAQQAAALLPANFSHIRAVREVRLAGCYALLVGFAEPLTLDWQAARVHDADVSWIAVNSSKPGRDLTRFSLVAQSSNSWAEAHLDDDPASVQRHLLKEIGEITGQNPTGAEHCVLHRWRYANLDRRDGELALVDTETRLAACGDWCREGRVEAAFTSARGVLSVLEPVI
jgi:predicted NAD/FAD-dependent oxidoreductase